MGKRGRFGKRPFQQGNSSKKNDSKHYKQYGEDHPLQDFLAREKAASETLSTPSMATPAIPSFKKGFSAEENKRRPQRDLAQPEGRPPPRNPFHTNQYEEIEDTEPTPYEKLMLKLNKAKPGATQGNGLEKRRKIQIEPAEEDEIEEVEEVEEAEEVEEESGNSDGDKNYFDDGDDDDDDDGFDINSRPVKNVSLADLVSKSKSLSSSKTITPGHTTDALIKKKNKDSDDEEEVSESEKESDGEENADEQERLSKQKEEDYSLDDEDPHYEYVAEEEGPMVPSALFDKYDARYENEDDQRLREIQFHLADAAAMNQKVTKHHPLLPDTVSFTFQGVSENDVASVFEQSMSCEHVSAALHPRLIKNLTQSRGSIPSSPEFQALFPCLDQYYDLSFALKTKENASSVRDAYLLHALNHVIKSRYKVQKHNSKLAALAAKSKPVLDLNDPSLGKAPVVQSKLTHREIRRLEKRKEKARAQNLQIETTPSDADELQGKPESRNPVAAEEPPEYRDQGFTRPKVLIVAPYKFVAEKIMHQIIDFLAGGSDTPEAAAIRHKDRFFAEYGDHIMDDRFVNKDEELKQAFEGNVGDCFRVGLALNRKSFNLYGRFYTSDIIIASPLGLRLMIGAEGDKGRDYDYLSSIEICIFDQMEGFLMQNWEHVTHAMSHINLFPAENRDTDYSRIKKWYLEGLSKNFRQSIFVSSFQSPEFNSLFRSCANYQGKVSVTTSYPSGSISHVIRAVPQVFHRVACSTPQNAAKARLLYFADYVLPTLDAPTSSHVCTFACSYFDFIRLKKFFNDREASYTFVSEYTAEGLVKKARGSFLKGERRHLLTTERAQYHYHSFTRGIRHLVFFGIPEFPEIYAEMVNMIKPEEGVTCTVVYTPYDALRLERVVGSARAAQLLRSEKSVHMFA